MAERRERKDAQHNRDRLVETALRLFAEDGPDVSPRRVAQEAGVGVGTLYRHFADRAALLEAVYLADLERLCASVTALLSAHGPAGALRAWLGSCVEHARTKRGLSEALRRAVGQDGENPGDSKAMLVDAVSRLLEAGVASTILRDDVLPLDVLVAVTGVAWAMEEYGDQAQVDRLLDFMLDSYRVGSQEVTR